MTKRIALLATLILTLVLLPGCPGASALVGTWVLTMNATEFGLELMADGTATSFTVDSALDGTLQWWENGDQIILNQNSAGSRKISTGLIVAGGTVMTGPSLVWQGTGEGTTVAWSAEKQ